MTNPTKRTYDDLNAAYDFFNERLFNNLLPRCLITMQRRSKAFGYFAGGRFGTRDGQEVTDEIALNPSHFKDRTTEQTLSTLVHEMVHLRQQHFGKPSNAYHNKEWAGMMKEIGLYPSSTGKEGGKEIGQSVSHYIMPGGPFALACADLTGKHGYTVSYIEVWGENEEAKKARAKKKAASKTKFTCPECGLNAWAKPDTSIICGDCQKPFEPEQAEDGQDGEEAGAED